MRTYILQRLLLAVPVLLGVSLLVAGLIRVVPGDAVLVKIAEAGRVSDLDKARRELGLDRSFPEQYLSWLGGAVRSDFGNSFINDRPVSAQILRALPVTIELAFLSLLIAIVIGVPVGVVSAMRQDTSMDYVGRIISVAGLSMPSFWIATLILLYFSIWFQWIPPIIYVPFTENPWANLQQFIVPALALGLHFSATSMRMVRSALLEVRRQDYMRTAIGKGLTEHTATIAHALKNALLPVVTVLGIQLSNLLGGTVVIETIFSMPGLGRLTLDAIQQRDYPTVQGAVLVVAAMVVGLNLVIDLLYAKLDPRIQYG